MNTRRYTGRFIAIVILLAALPALYAQESVGSHSATFSWGVALPMGDKNFTNKTTFITPQFGYEYRFASNFSAGFSLGLSFSNEKGPTNDLFDGDVVTANTHRKLTLIPVQAEFRYFPLGTCNTVFHPYIGLSGGIQYAQFYLTGDAIVTSKTGNWAEVVTPHLGVRYQPGGKRLYMDLRAQWQYSGNGWELTRAKSQQSIGIRVGIGYSF